MSFETQQLVVFAAILGGSLVLALLFAARAAYLAYRAGSGKERLDWAIAVAFAGGVSAFFGFQLWRIVVRF